MTLQRPQFLKQKNMVRVLYALAPVALAGIYFFGWRVVAILAVSAVFGFLVEWIMASQRKGKVSMACFVTTTLYALSLPPTTPFWIVAVGIIVALLFAKEVFGGFGKNVFNPAVVGRAFVYVCFPAEMTGGFVPAFRGFPGGFAQWSFASASSVPDYLSQAGLKITDAITAATPMWSFRDFGFTTKLKDLFTGSIGEAMQVGGRSMALAAGSIGEVSALILILCGIYFIATKTANWKLMLSAILGAVVMEGFFLLFPGVTPVPSIPFSLFSGAFLYATVFMVTDPVSAPKQSLSQWIYGAFIGAMIIFLRYKSVFAGGVGFAILLGNILSPSLDLWIKRIKEPAKEGAKA